MMEEKNKKKKYLLIGIVIALLLLLGSCACLKFLGKNGDNNRQVQPTPTAIVDNSEKTDKPISSSQSELKNPNDREYVSEETTEFVGYGTLLIDELNPYVYLQNLPDNTVYMEFVVSYDGEVIYESGLISPGKQEALDVFSICDSGEQVLNYDITTYDIDTRELCMAGISQQQKINVDK